MKPAAAVTLGLQSSSGKEQKGGRPEKAAWKLKTEDEERGISVGTKEAAPE